MLFLLLITIAAVFNANIGVSALQLPLPGGRAISYDERTGVLRIQLSTPPSMPSTITASSTIDPKTLESIKVRDTDIPNKGFGAFAIEKIEKDSFLGFYEGEIIKTREALEEIVHARKATNAMDYVMALDGGVTFVDGFKRAQDKSIFSPVHLNHAPKSAHGCNCQRLLFEDKVAFFTARGIEVNEELSFDYGNNFWVNRKDEIVHE